ncbi:MAG: phosphoribosyltransferase [Acidobacteria bacterium]|nr:phosphoribosyltransferase [Acidobacteriota bacterium]MCI0717890.1 phosphoribosyltransferase [Acidobacteriota bacterium]
MFRNRFEAGLQLAEALRNCSFDASLLAIPRGGIEVGHAVALHLKRPLDVIIPRKIASPENPELAVGAVTLDGSVEINRELVEKLGLTASDMEELLLPARAEIGRRLRLYRGDQPSPRLEGREVILIDDGLATGYTMMAAIKSVWREHPRRVVVAVPVSPESTYEHLRPMVDEVIVLHLARESFFAVSAFYHNFRDLPDEELIRLLHECNPPTQKSAQSNA